MSPPGDYPSSRQLRHAASVSRLPHWERVAEVAAANNPLAPSKGVEFSNYYAPSLYSIPSPPTDTLDLSPFIVQADKSYVSRFPSLTFPRAVPRSPFRVA